MKPEDAQRVIRDQGLCGHLLPNGSVCIMDFEGHHARIEELEARIRPVDVVREPTVYAVMEDGTKRKLEGEELRRAMQ